MDLTDFLLARIAEDEARVEGVRQGEGDPDFFWGPDRIRTVCAAHRRIVEHLRTVAEDDCEYSGWVWFAEMPLRELAAAHTDHPDYQDEWRPAPYGHECDQERLAVVTDEDGYPDREVCRVCGREWPR